MLHFKQSAGSRSLKAFERDMEQIAAQVRAQMRTLRALGEKYADVEFDNEDAVEAVEWAYDELKRAYEHLREAAGAVFEYADDEDDSDGEDDRDGEDDL